MNGENQALLNLLNDMSRAAVIKASSAMSKMLEFPVGVDIIPVEIRSVEKLNHILPDNERVVGLSVPITGICPGTFLLIYPEKSAFAVCDTMFHRSEGETVKFSEAEISALTELANIVIGNFLTSFAAPLKIDSFLHRSPRFSCDKFSIFMNTISRSLSGKSEDGMVIELAFVFRHIQIQGMAVFLFDKTNMLNIVRGMNT